MELILLKDVEEVGRKGDVLKVRDGFARNFLIPRKLALPATRMGREFIEEQKTRAITRREKEKNQALALSERLLKIKLTLEAAAGEQDKLYGSVTSEDIRQALMRLGYQIHKKNVHLQDSLRALGVYPVTVQLYPEVKATVTVEVIRKS